MRVTGGTARGRRLAAPAIAGARPTSDLVRSAVFNILGPHILPEARVLDLFAGTGSLGIEALSRGAAWADFVEMSSKQCSVIRTNLETTGFGDRAQVLCRRVERAVGVLAGPYRVVLMDPPYRLEELGPVLEAIDEQELVEDGGKVVVGHSKRVTLELSYGGLLRGESRRYGDSALDVFTAGPVL